MHDFSGYFCVPPLLSICSSRYHRIISYQGSTTARAASFFFPFCITAPRTCHPEQSRRRDKNAQKYTTQQCLLRQRVVSSRGSRRNWYMAVHTYVSYNCRRSTGWKETRGQMGTTPRFPPLSYGSLASTRTSQCAAELLLHSAAHASATEHCRPGASPVTPGLWAPRVDLHECTRFVSLPAFRIWPQENTGEQGTTNNEQRKFTPQRRGVFTFGRDYRYGIYALQSSASPQQKDSSAIKGGDKSVSAMKGDA